MLDHSKKPGLGGRLLRAMPSVLVHGLCLFALFELLGLGGGGWSRAADEVLLERNPTTDALLGLMSAIFHHPSPTTDALLGLVSAIVHHPSNTLVLLLVLLLIDFTLLIYLDRSGVWRLGRELWSGTLFVAIVTVAFLTAYSLSSDASRHWNHLARGHDIRRQQELRRLGQLAGNWRLVSEERDGETIGESELKSGELVIERREGLWIYDGGAEKGYNRPAYAMSLTLAGEERHGKVAVRIRVFTPEHIDLNYENKGYQEGIYRLDDNRLELCLSPSGSRDWPTEFSTKDSDNVLYVFERVATDQVAPR
jgi:uncharacterized protein (TIGR03067 family)